MKVRVRVKRPPKGAFIGHESKQDSVRYRVSAGTITCTESLHTILLMLAVMTIFGPGLPALYVLAEDARENFSELPLYFKGGTIFLCAIAWLTLLWRLLYRPRVVFRPARGSVELYKMLYDTVPISCIDGADIEDFSVEYVERHSRSGSQLQHH